MLLLPHYNQFNDEKTKETRKMTLLKSLLLTVAAATFATTPVLAGDDYTIVLDRPDKVGEKAEFAYSGDFQALQQLSANGKVAKLIKNDNYHA